MSSDQKSLEISRLKRNLRLKTILDEIVLGGVKLMAWGSASYGIRKEMGRVYYRLSAKTHSQQTRLRQKITRLESEKYIILEKDEYRLTRRGEELLKSLAVLDLKVKRPTSWDGQWRLVSYDIPSADRGVLNNFRRELKRLGFRLVQRSLWVIPWECKDEVLALAYAYQVAPYVIYMTTSRLPMADRLKQDFGLK